MKESPTLPFSDAIDQPQLDECSVDQSVHDVVVEGLVKRYGTTNVVDGISFSIPKGSVFGLIGPNGAGKSTTLKMLMRLTGITSGKASVLNADVATKFQLVKDRIGYVPEVHNMYLWMTIKRMIQFVSSFYPTWNQQRCSEMLELLELDASKKVKQLSKGMSAKLALLLAVCHEPDLLILDEPLSGLDPLVKEEFLDGVMQVICNGNSTVIFSSHTIDDIQRIADSVGILFNGKLLVHKSVDGLLGSTKGLRAVLPDESKSAWTPANAVYVRQHGRDWSATVADFSPELIGKFAAKNHIQNVEVVDLNLEDIFKDFIRGAKSK